MKKVYYLSTCDTCKRILKELDLPTDFELQDLKKTPITAAQLDEIKTLSGCSETALLNKRAQRYRSQNLKEKTLSNADCRALILEHYSFLKRPILIIDAAIFIGNAKKTVAAAKAKRQQLG